MKLLAATALFILWPTLSEAAWVEIEGGVTAKPDETNSTIELIMLHCVDGPLLDVYSRNDGPVLPDDGLTTMADYFYKKGAVHADIDGARFPLAAAGSDIAVVLFSEGTEAQGYLAPLDPAFLDALKTGTTLTLAFDISSGTGPDGSPLETWARFSLQGAGGLMQKAIAACG